MQLQIIDMLHPTHGFLRLLRDGKEIVNMAGNYGVGFNNIAGAYWG